MHHKWLEEVKWVADLGLLQVVHSSDGIFFSISPTGFIEMSMATRKAKARPSKPHITYQPSDYESDPTVLVSHGDPALNLPPPPPSTRTNTELNLSVLQRYLPFTTSILVIAPYAVVYTFGATTQRWEKSNIEGTLFVVGQSLPSASVVACPPPERYAVLVLNRRGLENFILELRAGCDVETTAEFVILQEAAEGEKVWGLWVFEEKEPASTRGMRGEVERVLKSCVARTDAANDSNNARLGGVGRDGLSANELFAPQEHKLDAASSSGLSERSYAHQPDQPQVQSDVRAEVQPSSGDDILGRLFQKARENLQKS